MNFSNHTLDFPESPAKRLKVNCPTWAMGLLAPILAAATIASAQEPPPELEVNFSDVPVWSDEFNNPEIDRSSWTFDIGGGGWGNNELQYYLEDNAFIGTVSDGELEASVLVIEARQERYRNRQYTSARLKTQGLQNWTYGRVEARIQIPEGQGIWPAFWMLGTDITSVGWPDCGEIDIMENIGREPNLVHGNIHGPGYFGADGIQGTVESSGGAFADAFYTYAIEWQPGLIEWFVNDTRFHWATPLDLPVGSPWVFDHPFFIVLNVAVGGDWPGAPNDDTVFPQQMLVDYVRVYEAILPEPPVGDGAIFVDDINMGINKTGPLWQATALVTVVDDAGPVEGVTVDAAWSGLVSGGNTSFVTDSWGIAGPFYSHKTREKGTITFTVLNLSKDGMTYTPSLNAETSDAISK
jgi:beta-glucanase (GH16 family)